MELSVSMLMQVNRGKKKLSGKAVFRLETLEKSLGLAVQESAEPVARSAKNWGLSCTCPIISWASAGDSRAFEDQGEDNPRIATDCKDPNCYALTVDGDSMSPIYLHGDVVVVAPNQEARHGDLVVAKTKEDEVYFKRLEFSRDMETIRLISFNPNYPAMEFKKSDLRFVQPVFSIVRYPQKKFNH